MDIFRQFLLSVIITILIPGALFSSADLPEKQMPSHTVEEGYAVEIPQIEIQHISFRESEPVYINVKREDGMVQEMELEQYVLGVVLGEMPASFAPEALKAQAVAARTYAIRSILEMNHDGAVCTDSRCCQNYCDPVNYSGGEKYLQNALSAVRQTAGVVATYQSRPICAVYFASAGGATEAAAAVWGSDIPYLQSVKSPEESVARQSCTVTMTAAQFQQKLGGKIEGSPSQWFGKVTYTAGGGVRTMQIGGSQYTGLQLRKMLNLRSTVFQVKVKGENITIITDGHGHRVGMSQYGAQSMALEGSSYQEILKHYYQGITLEKYPLSGD